MPIQTLVPEHGGLLMEVEAVDLLRRLPSGSCQLIYIDPPWFSVDFAGIPTDRSGDSRLSYLRLMKELLLHAKRVLAPTGNLFVHYPSQNPLVDLGAALAQLFGQAQTYRISVPARQGPSHLAGVPRSDLTTIFFARASENAVYHPPLRARRFGEAAMEDDHGRFRWELLEAADTLKVGRVFEFEGDSPGPGKVWRYSLESMAALRAKGRLERFAAGRWRMKHYEHELPPAEISLEWSDLSTFVPPGERAVEGKGRHDGPQEPLALLRRIIEMGSNAGDLVAVLSFGGAGTGAVASHHLGRRWVANSTPLPVAQWVCARLLAEGLVVDGDFEIVPQTEVHSQPTLPVDDVPLLLTADEMRDSARRTESLRHMVTRSFMDEHERGVAEGLLNRGVIAVHEFRPPGTLFVIDVFLPGPPFGVVEVKSGDWIRSHRRDAIEKLLLYGQALSTNVRLYLVLFAARHQSASAVVDEETGVVVVTAPEGNWDEAAQLVAEDHALHQRRLGEVVEPTDFIVELASDEDELTKELSRLTMNLDPLFLAEGRAVLEHEIRQLLEEIRHSHFTAAALRVGRSLEFIIYQACRSWGVSVREPILVGLTKLEDSKKELARKLIEYADIGGDEADAKKAKASVLTAAKKLQNIVTDVISDVNSSTAKVEDGTQPTRNAQALINDISKTHGRLSEVREATRKMKEPVDHLLKMRNAAAHASTDGETREVSREELSVMVGYLNEAFLGLSRCGTAIRSDRQDGAQ